MVSWPSWSSSNWHQNRKSTAPAPAVRCDSRGAASSDPPVKLPGPDVLLVSVGNVCVNPGSTCHASVSSRVSSGGEVRRVCCWSSPGDPVATTVLQPCSSLTPHTTERVGMTADTPDCAALRCCTSSSKYGGHPRPRPRTRHRARGREPSRAQPAQLSNAHLRGSSPVLVRRAGQCPPERRRKEVPATALLYGTVSHGADNRLSRTKHDVDCTALRGFHA